MRVVEILILLNAIGASGVGATRWYLKRVRRTRRESHKDHVAELLKENSEMDYMIDKMKRDERRTS